MVHPIVHTLPAARLGAPVYFAALAGPRHPGAAEAMLGQLAGAAFPAAREGTPGARPPFPLCRSPLGRPFIRLGPAREISVSFSTTSRGTRAALAPWGRIGIDAACPAEFDGAYPFSRVFRNREWAMARLACGRRDRAATMLWSAKEACVKAAGTGFHTLDPRRVECVAIRPCGHGLRLDFRRPVAARVLAWEGDGAEWLSIAWSGETHGDH